MAILADIKGGKLIITADIDGKMIKMWENGNSTSKSSTSTILASTGGYIAVGDIKYSLNVIKVKK